MQPRVRVRQEAPAGSGRTDAGQLDRSAAQLEQPCLAHPVPTSDRPRARSDPAGRCTSRAPASPPPASRASRTTRGSSAPRRHLLHTADTGFRGSRDGLRARHIGTATRRSGAASRLMSLVLRPATADDAATIHALIVALAEYEREPDAVVNTPRRPARTARRPAPALRVPAGGGGRRRRRLRPLLPDLLHLARPARALARGPLRAARRTAAAASAAPSSRASRSWRSRAGAGGSSGPSSTGTPRRAPSIAGSVRGALDEWTIHRLTGDALQALASPC